MDDVGIDQMEAFGYGGGTPPSMPNIGAIAGHGIRFRNAWAMPACSTTRGVIFDGRFPLRTNVKGALGENDLANSMVNPYEVTVPKLLARRGYESALFGKFHLALQGNDPAGYGMVANLGWNYFAGWLDETGDPSSIDTTAGGVAPLGTWHCGFVPGAAQGGADQGACYHADGSCRELSSSGPVPPGRTCRDEGGILDPDQACRAAVPSYIDFETLSAHYVSPLVYNYADGSYERVPPTDPRARQFRATFAVDAAIDWIKERPGDRPWMATVSFASDHTPLMQPPVSRDLPGSATSSDLDCANQNDQRVLSNLMIESLDLEVGRLLVETGLARRGRDGRLVYRPGQTETMVVIIGDNGSLGTTVKVPFSVSRSKGTAYQTGVWVPLIVSGPLVRAPGRRVEQMVNAADLYALFGEIAGFADVQAEVPRPIDARPMLPYVTNPAQGSIRAWNYTEVGVNLQANGAINGPCAISSTCTQIPVSKSVCEDNNGIWWGAGLDDPITEGAPPTGFTYCCEVNQFVIANGRAAEPYDIAPLVSVGIRNDRYKIVENSLRAYVSQDEPCVDTTTMEFYEIDEAVPVPKLDNEGEELDTENLTPVQQRNYDALLAQLQALRDSVPDCPGDGNIDFVINQADLDDWRFYADLTGQSSVYDVNLDGLTDETDRSLIESYLGTDCR
ncbi:sulfatase-like hydrolase/transferase [bacterium]|nr:sulfatase-like hydrolase/transferase [bacterium]